MKKLTKAKAESISEDFRRQLNLSKLDPLCGFELAKFLKVRVAYPNELGLSEEEVNHFNTLSGLKFSGVSISFPDSKKLKHLVILNPFHSEKRNQVTIMHELSHIILEHDVSDRHPSGLWLPHRDQKQEEEADTLAWALKIPRYALLKALQKGMSEGEISDHFKISRELVKARINTSGVKKQLAAMKRKYCNKK